MPNGCEHDEDREGLGRKVEDRLLKSRTIILSQPIDDQIARKVIAQLLVLEGEDPEKEITLIVNSPGGSADSGFAIYDLARFVAPPVRTICSGLCASAAVIIYLAAPKGKRLALPNARFLIHQPSTMAYGTASDIAITAREILALKKRYNVIVAQETGKTLAQVDKDVNRDFWLSAEEAKAYGLVDRIVERRKDV